VTKWAEKVKNAGGNIFHEVGTDERYELVYAGASLTVCVTLMGKNFICDMHNLKSDQVIA
jgi:hypothetical protein